MAINQDNLFHVLCVMEYFARVEHRQMLHDKVLSVVIQQLLLWHTLYYSRALPSYYTGINCQRCLLAIGHSK